MHEISCGPQLWQKLLDAVRARGRGRSRESGAFLIGYREAGVSRVIDFVLYDDLDPCCLDSGIVRFDGRYFGTLWDLCKRRNLAVVADIHTHPGSSKQSDSDRAHPMIASRGHIALILPNFAAPPVRLEEIGMYRYEGARRWHTVPVESRHKYLRLVV